MSVTFIKRDPDLSLIEQARQIAAAIPNTRYIRASGESITVYTQWKEES